MRQLGSLISGPSKVTLFWNAEITGTLFTRGPEEARRAVERQEGDGLCHIYEGFDGEAIFFFFFFGAVYIRTLLNRELQRLQAYYFVDRAVVRLYSICPGTLSMYCTVLYSTCCEGCSANIAHQRQHRCPVTLFCSSFFSESYLLSAEDLPSSHFSASALGDVDMYLLSGWAARGCIGSMIHTGSLRKSS